MSSETFIRIHVQKNNSLANTCWAYNRYMVFFPVARNIKELEKRRLGFVIMIKRKEIFLPAGCWLAQNTGLYTS
jgi:hypothetical protein